MKRICDALAFICMAFCTAPAWSQGYPYKPIRIVVPIAAGGANDTIARAVGRRLSQAWGQPVVIENKPGANTQIGAEYVAKSAADGYTLLTAAERTFVVNPFLYSKLAYDPGKDFTPVSGLGLVHQALVVNPSVPVRNVAELIALAAAKPGELSYGTLGIGSSPHLNMELLESMAGVKLNPIQYNSSARALNDVIAGHIQMMFINVGIMVQPWKLGQLRPLGIGSTKRLAQFPELPTIAESGVRGFEAVSWFGLFAPSATPRDVVRTLNDEVRRIDSDPDFQETFMAPNFYAPLSGVPDEFAGFVNSESMKWRTVIEEKRIKID